MKRFTFPLATVLRVRRIEEEQAVNELVVANWARQEAERRERRAEQRLAEAEIPARPLPSVEWHRHHAGVELVAASWWEAKHRAENAQQAAAARREEWVKAHQRVQILERLEARRRAAWALEAERALVREVDDMVAARWISEHQGEEADR